MRVDCILLTRFHPYISKGHNSGKGHNPDGGKKCVSYFFLRNPYMKFQNPSMHSSEVMLCIKNMQCKNAKGYKGP